MRLAWRTGWVDVDAMLQTLTTEQFSEWIAADRLGLDEDGWFQAATVATTVQNEAEVTRCVLAAERPKVKNLAKITDFIPFLRKKKKSSMKSHARKVAQKHAG